MRLLNCFVTCNLVQFHIIFYVCARVCVLLEQNNDAKLIRKLVFRDNKPTTLTMSCTARAGNSPNYLFLPFIILAENSTKLCRNSRGRTLWFSMHGQMAQAALACTSVF